MEEQKNMSWLEQEEQELKQNTAFQGEKKEALKLEDKQMVEVDIDFSKPFDKWVDPTNPKTVRKIIPVKYNGKDMVFWLNPANPVYRELVQAGMKGQTHFKIMRSGMAKATKYIIVR